MKKISMVALLGAFFGLNSFAANNMMVVSVEEVQNMPDNAPVVVRGYLVEQNGENSYMFRDGTGTINLEIEEEDWNGQTFVPTDFIEVWGEVDKNGMNVTEIDVSAMKKL
ncbi:MAG: NirD/YgiW/YdeI family stress tolerance protein [Alphaproteobacteria bacterium]|nr:NirD/YgiW/YdeI family stress tolerance protein [Alphaproteobacteria bacterium]